MLTNENSTKNIGDGFNPSNQLSKGTILVDRYLIQGVVGLGGMGSVYCAKDLHFPNVEKIVAVKEMINLAPDPVVRESIVQNFEREANILVTLSHPSIPQIFDYFTHEERSYLVEEFINGRDIQKVLEDSDTFLPEEQVIAWAVELCDVLNFLHTHKPEPVIFRDMKPSNVMIDNQNHIFLVDFGIAKIFRIGQKGTMIGTEGYSPPEQYRGEASPQADIYALGATLHHILTRHDPRLEAPFTFSERPVRQLNPNVSIELETIINTALQYSPQDRFPSANAMKESLLMAAKTTGALKSRYFSTSSIVSTQQAIKPLWTFAAEDEIRGSVFYDRGIVYVGSYDNNLYAVNGKDGSFAWKYPSDGGVVGRPAVDHGVLYFGSEDHKLYAISQRSGKLLWNYSTDDPIRCSPIIAEGHVFIGSDDGFLHAVNMTSHRCTWRVDAISPIRSSPFVTSENVYFGCESGEFFAIDFRGEVRWRFKAKRAVTSSPTVADGTVFFSSLDSSFYALDAKSGWVLWRFHMGKGSISSPCAFEKYVFVGSADNNIYCLDARSGKEIWRFACEHQVSGSPVVYKENLFCGAADGNIYCLDYRTGKLRWKYATGGPITGTPLIESDVLYIGSLDHILYSLMV